MSDPKLNVRYFTHNAKQASDWKEAIAELCKAIEQLSDDITDLKKAQQSGK